MIREQQKHRQIREALCALLSDIEGMYQGPETLAQRAQSEEFFGPFSVGKLGGTELQADISVSWPNLAISMRNAKNALLDGEPQEGH